VSDLPPPVQSVRTALLLHALIAAGILVVVAVSGGDPAKAFGIAAAYFVLAGGWSWLRGWRAGRSGRARNRGGEPGG
jgi:small neutral amino acid transporter SnatA (MarC family)